MKRTKAKLAEFFRVKHGYAFKSDFFDSAGPYALLTPGNFNESGGFRERGEKQPYYTGEVPHGFVLEEGDVIVAMTEQEHGLLGSSAWVPKSGYYLHNQRLGRIVELDESRLDKRFLFYLFNTREVRAQISGSASGTKVRHTAPERIGRVEANLPPINDQKRIASILTAYDDLMENNRRRMALLEESARQLYQEWFVRLRFRGHKPTLRAQGLPEGWKRVTLNEVTTFLKRGVTPIYDDEAEGLVINQKCIRDGRLNMDLARHQSRDFKSERQIQVGDVLINSTGEGTLGRVAQVKNAVENCTVDTHVTIARPTDQIPRHYFGLALMEWEPRFSTMGRGATNQTELSPSAIGESVILLPSEHIGQRFESWANPIYQQVSTLILQNQKLRTARDLLLPKLMSGELAV